MHISKKQLSETEINLTFKLSEADLGPAKKAALEKLGKDVKVSGFREGKAPLAMIEKNVNQEMLQTEVIEQAVNVAYVKALDEQNIRPVARPDVSIKKFVPFTELEFESKVNVIGEVKLPDYKKIKQKKETASVTDKDIEEVLKSLQERAASGKEVTREAKKGDRATIEFKGVDEKGKAINGAEGKDYPLTLGSNTFIPGFEDELIGKKPGKEFSFKVTFPKDYGVKAMAGKKVEFTVTITKLEELTEPKLDDAFASSIGPFKTIADLKRDIKAQLTQEKQSKLDRDYEQKLIEKIVEKSKLGTPKALIEDEMQKLKQELLQNLMYRGQTWQEYLAAEGKTEEEFDQEVLEPQAEMRIKAGLVLAEIADKEGVSVKPEEIEVRVQLLKGQYQDPAMQAELDKPDNQRDIGARMITEKTVEKLVEYASK